MKPKMIKLLGLSDMVWINPKGMFLPFSDREPFEEIDMNKAERDVYSSKVEEFRAEFPHAIATITIEDQSDLLGPTLVIRYKNIGEGFYDTRIDNVKRFAELVNLSNVFDFEVDSPIKFQEPSKSLQEHPKCRSSQPLNSDQAEKKTS